MERQPLAARALRVEVGERVADAAQRVDRVLRSHRRRLDRFAEACRREDPALGPDAARERAQAILASLTGFGLTSLIDPTFDMAAHARGLLDGAARRV